MAINFFFLQGRREIIHDNSKRTILYHIKWLFLSSFCSRLPLLVQSESLVNKELFLHYMAVPQTFCKEVRITYVLWILKEWVTIYCEFYTAYFSTSPQNYPKIILKKLSKDRGGRKKWGKDRIGSHTLDPKSH